MRLFGTLFGNGFEQLLTNYRFCMLKIIRIKTCITITAKKLLYHCEDEDGFMERLTFNDYSTVRYGNKFLEVFYKCMQHS